LQFLAYWITPWQITANTAVTFPTSGASVTTINVGPIGECGTLRIKINVGCLVMALGSIITDETLNIPIRFTAWATNIFAVCQTNGSMLYMSVNEQQQLAVLSASEAYTTAQKNSQGFKNNPPLFPQNGYYTGVGGSGGSYGYTALFESQTNRTKFATQGKYLGTYIALTAGLLSDLGASSLWNTSTSNLQIGFGSPTFTVASQDVDAEGQVGPARILRWDNVSAGVQINVAGKLWMQAIPTSALSPYVKQQVMMQNRWCSEGAIRLVASLVEGATPLRRAWNLRVYQRFIREEIDKLDLQELARLAAKDEHIAEAMQSTGLMAALGEIGEREPAVGVGNFGAAGNFQQHYMGGLIRQRSEYM
jgi:hypothetical protein